MKEVINSKEWTKHGWRYRMSRTVAKQQVEIHLEIPNQELHYRDIVAMRVREARRKLMREIYRIRLLQFT